MDLEEVMQLLLTSGKIIIMIVVHWNYLTGKTASLRLAQNLYGLNGLESNDSKSPLINQAAMTTLPIALDDVDSAKKFECIAVQFFNQASYTTNARGELKPRTSLIISVNQPYTHSDRYE